VFPSTRQTLLRDATAGTPFALNAVAGMYWQPCFRYLIARWRLPRDQAEDLVQGFFAALVEQELLARYDSSRGPFRPWLRACLDGFVRKDNERVAAAKRGGGAVSVPIDSSPDLASPGLTPEQIFHREWQREMFAQAAAELQTQCEADGRPERFQVFAAYDLAEDVRPSYDDLAQAHGLPVTAVTNHLAWARREMRKLLEARVGRLSGTDRERQRELRSLFTPAGSGAR